MKYYLIILSIITLSSANARINNPVAFIGEQVKGDTAGAPLSTDANHQLISGITNSEATATADTTTTSTTDVLINAMTLSPSAGTYLAIYSTCVDHSAQSVAVVLSIYVGGSLITDSVRSPVPRFNALGANSLNPCVAIQNIVAVTAGQAVEARWKTASGTATSHQRTLSLVRLL